MEKVIEELFNISLNSHDEVPVSAIIVDENGTIISSAVNSCEQDDNVLSHAEIKAIDKALKIRKHSLKGCTIYVLLEPCLMCFGAILNSEISNIIYLVRNEDSGAFSYYHTDTQKNKIIIHCLDNEDAKEIIKRFFEKCRNKNKSL